MPAKEKIITVFGSSRPKENDSEYEQARELGWALAEKGFIVCSGGYGGVMEAVSRGAKDAGGRTLAVTADFFEAKANRWVDDEVRVRTWQQRLFKLVRFGRGYVACKGGTGTLVELAVVWEMLNKRVMQGRPFVALTDFWKPIIDRVREVEAPAGAAPSKWLESAGRMIHFASSPAAAADFLDKKMNSSSK